MISTIRIQALALAPALALAFSLLAAPAAAQDEPARPDLDDLAFLAGTWRGDFNGSILEESFSKPEAGTLVGRFRWISGDTTRFTEMMTFEQRDDGVHYFLRHFHPGLEVWAQEADGPMHMRLVNAEANRAVLEDEARAFPRHIIYHRTDPHTMQVRLEGHGDDGTERAMVFTFRRIDMTVSTETLTTTGQSLGYDGGLTVAFEVKDMGSAIDWYQDTLGFKLLYRMDDIGWCELGTGVPGVSVGLSQVEQPKPGGPTPTFGVRDIDEARSTLESKSVRFDGPTRDIAGMVKLATFYDPDGNTLMFSQTLAPAGP